MEVHSIRGWSRGWMTDSHPIVRWLREGLGWRPAAIMWTGSKRSGLDPHTAAAFGIDARLIGRPEHPCRLPGQRHAKTGCMSRVLGLRVPSFWCSSISFSSVSLSFL
jgi:hypothetical protein